MLLAGTQNPQIRKRVSRGKPQSFPGLISKAGSQHYAKLIGGKQSFLWQNSDNKLEFSENSNKTSVQRPGLSQQAYQWSYAEPKQ